MKWLRDLLDQLRPQKVDTDDRARRQWRKVRDADRVVRAYRELDGALQLHVRRK